MHLKQLQGVLVYKRQALEQFLAVASIFGGFAVTGIIALRSETQRDRVASVAFGRSNRMGFFMLSLAIATAAAFAWNLHRLFTK